MILSNFTSLFTSNNNYFDIYFLENQNSLFRSSYIDLDASIQKYPILLALNTKNSNEYSSISTKNLRFKEFIRPNFWQKFYNKYLQETIFLSPVNKKNSFYIHLLKKKGLSVYNNSQNKYFLNKFNKDLINGSVFVKYDSNFIKDLEGEGLNYFKYSWSKVLYVQILKIASLKKNINSFFFRKEAEIFNHSIPLFVLTNDKNEVIMSESVSQLPKLGHLSTLYGNLFNQLFSKSYRNPSYTCLIFINHNDAIEYRDFLKYKNSFSTNSLNIKVVPSNIKLYFKLKSIFVDTVDFRLVPDLKEVSDLLYKYSNYRNVSFDKNQRYGKTFFQGQPLYKIKDLNFKHVKKYSPLDRVYFFANDKKYSNLNTFFLNYNTVLNTWEKFREENNNIDLPKNPQVVVSNVELFIKNNTKEKEINQIVFLPSLETYKFIKDYLVLNLKNQSIISSWLSSTSLTMKTICYRVFWSLASRQPNTL